MKVPYVKKTKQAVASLASKNEEPTTISDRLPKDNRKESAVQQNMIASANKRIVQKRMILQNAEIDAAFLAPEFLETKLGIQPPQLYKDLYYKLDDAKTISI